MTHIQISEDDEGLRNLYPVQAWGEVAGDLQAATQSAKDSALPGGGWSDMHVIQPPRTGYGALDLPAAPLARALGQILPRVPSFEVGFGAGNPFHRLETDALCFGTGPDLFVKLETTGSNLAAIWFDFYPLPPDAVLRLSQTLQAIERFAPSLVADYRLNAVGRLSDPDFLRAYLQAATDSGN